MPQEVMIIGGPAHGTWTKLAGRSIRYFPDGICPSADWVAADHPVLSALPPIKEAHWATRVELRPPGWKIRLTFYADQWLTPWWELPLGKIMPGWVVGREGEQCLIRPAGMAGDE